MKCVAAVLLSCVIFSIVAQSSDIILESSFRSSILSDIRASNASCFPKDTCRTDKVSSSVDLLYLFLVKHIWRIGQCPSRFCHGNCCMYTFDSVGEPHQWFPRLGQAELPLWWFVHSFRRLLSGFEAVWAQPTTISWCPLQLSTPEAVQFQLDCQQMPQRLEWPRSGASLRNWTGRVANSFGSN